MISKKIFFKIFLFIFIILIGLAFRSLWYSGVFSDLQEMSTFNTHIITGIIGAEDITIDHAKGLAFISSCDRRSVLAGKKIKGSIYLLDLNDMDKKPREISSSFQQEDFRPHGISFFTDPMDSTQWLHVINHRETGHFIEIFQFRDSILVHHQTIKSNLFFSPNDLVATGKNSFYFTNDHESGRNWLTTIKDFLMIGTGSVGYYDGSNVKLLAKGIRYANGINIDQSYKKLYVAACTEGNIYVYETSPFTKICEIKCKTGVDNLEWDENGNLWVGAHPKLLKFLGHAKDRKKLSPSQVLMIDLKNDQNARVENIYINDGEPLSGSSVAAPYKNTILVGSVFEDGVLVLDKSIHK